MGAVPSKQKGRPRDASEYLIGTFIGEKSFPLSSDFWQKLLEQPLTLQWPQERVTQACQTFACNNYSTRHLVKLLIHLALTLQESTSISADSSRCFIKAINAASLSSLFLKFMIECSTSDNLEELYLFWEEETINSDISVGQNILNFIMRRVLTYIGASELSSQSYLLHHELLGFLLITLSTQLRGSSLNSRSVHPFLDAVMNQESDVVTSVIRRLLVSYISQPFVPLSSASLPVLSYESQVGVLRKVGSVAANFMILSYYTLNSLVNSSGDGQRSPLAVRSLFVLLLLIHYRKYVMAEDTVEHEEQNSSSQTSLLEKTFGVINPYFTALGSVKDVEFDRVDVEGNTSSGLLVRLPFASLFDRLCMCMGDETSVLLLYSLLHGNSNFFEYVLVRTDLDNLLVPLLEMLYNASMRTSKQIYMLLIIFLILSQDSSFSASVHKLILPTVSWHKERLLHNSSLGSLMIVVLIRTIKYNLSMWKDVYLHTNCLGILANMAPHVHRLGAYASQRLICLFNMLSRKYMKLAKLKDEGSPKCNDIFSGGDSAAGTLTELCVYTDFLRIVLEIINSILTYALPRNPEVIYAIMHRQEVFLPFKGHPCFSELLENIFMVLDFFNNRMDAVEKDGDWSVEKVRQMIDVISRSWHGEGMKMFTQLRFTYEQENHPEEFFIPYTWQLIFSHSDFTFNADAISLFPIDMPSEVGGARNHVNQNRSPGDHASENSTTFPAEKV